MVEDACGKLIKCILKIFRMLREFKNSLPSSYYFFKLEVPLYTEARTNHPTGIAAEVVADFYLATYAEVLAAEVLAYVVPELWLCGEDGVLWSEGYVAVLVELQVAILVLERTVGLPPVISEAAKVQTL